MGNKCCKCKSSAYSSVNGTVRSFSSHNSSVGRWAAAAAGCGSTAAQAEPRRSLWGPALARERNLKTVSSGGRVNCERGFRFYAFVSVRHDRHVAYAVCGAIYLSYYTRVFSRIARIEREKTCPNWERGTEVRVSDGAFRSLSLCCFSLS